MAERKATVERNTLETQVTVTVNLDGTGQTQFATGVPFLEHMLDQVARHGMVDLAVKAVGDLHIDDHHTVEDIGITLGPVSYTPLTLSTSDLAYISGVPYSLKKTKTLK